MIPTSEQLVGKVVATRHYFHVSALDAVDSEVRDVASRASELASVSSDNQFNVYRADLRAGTVALLHYPGFFDDACPLLERSWKVDLPKGRVTHRTYESSLNPPVLHRKELLLRGDDANYSRFAALTKQLEDLGLFEDPIRIGFKVQWDTLLRERGFKLRGHELVPIGNDEGESDPAVFDFAPPGISRHLTALTRHSFSAPIQLFSRHGFLDGTLSLFDYGCGKGDDVRGLTRNGVTASGWDPYYASDQSVFEADLVNLGFVINVIEDPVERREALSRAYELAKRVLAVSTMLATEQAQTGRSFADGILTGRGTFQKYYSQHELKVYLQQVLAEEPISVAASLGYKRVGVVGHDIGLMVAYAYAAQYPTEVDRIVLMDAFLPGVGDWTSVWLLRDLWHFHFYGKTPLALVDGRERIYFEHFWNDFAADPAKSVSEKDRQLYAAAYAQPGGMRAGFEVFRAFEQDAKDFAGFAKIKLKMPMLVLTGEKASGEFLITQGRLVAENVEGVVIKGSGHWLMDEAPDQVVPRLIGFFGR